MADELEIVVRENNLDEAKQESIVSQFGGFLEKAKAFADEAKKIKITTVEQVDDMKKARALRLEIKAIRTNAENIRKQLKEQALREGRAIDGAANIVKALTVPVEQYLEDQEKFAERLEAARIDKLAEERTAQLAEYVDDVSIYDVRTMSKAGFDELLSMHKKAHDDKIAAEKKAEEARIAKEKADQIEQERIKKENETLKAEAEAKEKALEIERQKALQERKKVDAEIEQARKAKEEADRKLAEKEAAEIKAKYDAEEKEAQQKIEADRLAKEEEYKKFLARNGVDGDTKPLFHIEKLDKEVRLYKLVDTFNIK